MDVANEFLIVGSHHAYLSDMLFWDDQDMRRSLRMDVVKRKRPIVLVSLFRGDGPVDDFAEETVGHGYFLYTSLGSNILLPTTSLPSVPEILRKKQLR